LIARVPALIAVLWATLGLALVSAQAQDGARPSLSDAILPAGHPIFWADGIFQIDDLPAYHAMGLNTVVVRLTWSPSPDGSITPNDWGPQRAFAEAAAKAGLNVIYALPAVPTGFETQFRVSADSPAYLSLWTNWIEGAIASLKNTPHLLGWMLPDDPRALPVFDDRSYQKWIAQNYANLAVVNTQWKASFTSLDDVTLANTAVVIEKWRGYGPISSEMTMDEVKARMKAANERTNDTNFAFHPAALALAQYRWDTYRDLINSWVQGIRATDSDHLIFSGKLPDYAQLLAQPAGIDVSVSGIAPDNAENDIVTHDPQAVDIARRGGRFKAIPILTTHALPGVPAAALPELMPRWIQESWAHGASGVAFESWPTLQQSPDLAATIKRSLDGFNAPAKVTGWGDAPIASAAILLTPLADGATVQYGLPPTQTRRGLYGFGEDMVPDEPSDLVWEMRWGTAFGTFDYLTPQDLATAPLARYTTILVPEGLSVTNDVAQQLSGYVSNGGTLVADLGLGAEQNAGQCTGFSPDLGSLFGVPPGWALRDMAFNLSGANSHPLLPTWTRLNSSRPGIQISAGDGPDGAAFAGPTGYTPAAPQSMPLATGPIIAQDFDVSKQIWRTFLTLNEFGHGYAIYAPFRLWNFWRPSFAGFDEFHGDLLGRGALAVETGVSTLVPSPRTTLDGSTQFPELVNHTSGITLINHSAPGQADQFTQVNTSGTGDWLWSGCIVVLPAGGDNSILGGRPAPIDAPSDYEARARPVALYCVISPGHAARLQMRPIMAQNLAGGSVAGSVVAETPSDLHLMLWANAKIVMQHEGQWEPALDEATNMRVTIVDSTDGYEAKPGSRHQAIITEYGKGMDRKGRYPTRTLYATADANGRLAVEFSGIATGVEISPAPAAP